MYDRFVSFVSCTEERLIHVQFGIKLRGFRKISSKKKGQRAYKQWQSQLVDDIPTPMPRSAFTDMLESLGHQVSNAKTKDDDCCTNKFRTAKNVDVKNWTELGLKKT